MRYTNAIARARGGGTRETVSKITIRYLWTLITVARLDSCVMEAGTAAIVMFLGRLILKMGAKSSMFYHYLPLHVNGKLLIIIDEHSSTKLVNQSVLFSFCLCVYNREFGLNVDYVHLIKEQNHQRLQSTCCSRGGFDLWVYFYIRFCCCCCCFYRLFNVYLLFVCVQIKRETKTKNQQRITTTRKRKSRLNTTRVAIGRFVCSACV